MKRRSTPGGDSRSSKGTGWRACARPGSGGSQRAHLTMRGVRKGAPGAYCLLEWRLAIWGYMKRVTISFWRVGNGHLLKYKDNQPVLNTHSGYRLMSLNWNQSAKSTCFSPGLFSCQCRTRQWDNQRESCFGESEMEESLKRVNFLKVHRYDRAEYGIKKNVREIMKNQQE